jgi:hypothetical protein
VHLGVLEFREAVRREMAKALGIPVPRIEWRAGGVGADNASGRTLALTALAARGVPGESVSDTGVG